jgi:hypothetical protein
LGCGRPVRSVRVLKGLDRGTEVERAGRRHERLRRPRSPAEVLPHRLVSKAAAVIENTENSCLQNNARLPRDPANFRRPVCTRKAHRRKALDQQAGSGDPDV